VIWLDDAVDRRYEPARGFYAFNMGRVDLALQKRYSRPNEAAAGPGQENDELGTGRGAAQTQVV